ncbi:MAG: glycosyltransferase family 2 protein [Anaerolineales bacterium]
MTKLATITINHQHGEMIKKTIESLSALTRMEVDHFQMFVINNTPDQPTKEWLNESFPQIRCIENPQPKGFAANINQIIKSYPDYDYYLLVNPDVICLPGMIEKLVAVMNTGSDIGIAGPLLMDFDGSIQPSRRRFATFWVLIMRALHVDAVFKNLPSIERYLMQNVTFLGTSEVDWLTGAVMILRKKALDQVGLMDERFFMYFEDEDLCCRMWRNGWKVFYVTDAKAYHAHIAEGRKRLFSKANFRHISSALKMFFKYRGKISQCGK